MFKALIFTGGLFTGVYVGITLRDKGISTRVKKAMITLKDDRIVKDKNPNFNKEGIDEIFDYYDKGLLDEDKLNQFREMVHNKRYGDIGKLSLTDQNEIFKQPQYRAARDEYNNFSFKKE